MSTKYLGATSTFTAAAGPDLPAPRERARPVRAAGDGFARYWMHNGLVGMGGEKMSKSLGNSLLVTEMLPGSGAASSAIT